jgi:hypothetical protein
MISGFFFKIRLEKFRLFTQNRGLLKIEFMFNFIQPYKFSVRAYNLKT